MYDGNGNILSKETFAYTTGSVTSGTGTVQSYFYNNRDQLQSYNGQTFAYDAVGNPTTYKGKALTWNKGRKLVNFNGTTFTYDAQGKRIRKNSTAYYYNSAGQLLKSSDGMEYFYGNNGVMGFVYSGNKYVYRKNLQGDVIEILDSNGNSVVQYVYDAWGSCTVSTTSNQTLAQINPFRYRGYFYDVETGLYFLKTRYYDPTIGRFINMDSIIFADMEIINGFNLYCYCSNDPINYYDPSGCIALTITLSTTAVYYLLAAIGVIAIGTMTYIESETHAIQNALTTIGESLISLGDQIINKGYESEDNYVQSNIDTVIIESSVITEQSNKILTNNIGEIAYPNNIYYYKRKKAGPRIRSRSKKRAKDKAFLKGGKRKPVHHPHGKHGPHYHPADPRFQHWHYYYMLLLLLGYEEMEDNG